MTIINVKYLKIDQEKSKQAKKSPPTNKQPELQTTPPQLELGSGADLKSKYAEILLQVLTNEPQLFSNIGNLVHEMCLEKLGMSGKEVRVKVFPEKVKLIDAFRKLIGDKAVIIDASTYSTISLRR